MSIFNDILVQGVRSGQVPARTKSAREWYRNAAGNLSRTISGKSLMSSSPTQVVSDMEFGLMYSFVYDPKMKKTLPYYDTFPLIFPISFDRDSFVGINFHYLPHVLRAKLMDALYTTVTNKKYDESTRVRVSYTILNSAAKYKMFKPTVKRYLREHVRSRFLEISSSDWDTALFLPTESFRKADTQKVWAESRKQIG